MEALPKICKLCLNPKTRGLLVPPGVCSECADWLRKQSPTEDSEVRERTSAR